MNLKQTRLVTDDVQELTSFYEKLTGATADVISSGYVELQQSPCTGLAITSAAAAEIYGEGVVATGANPALVLDFEVRDVDAHYTRMMLRDPDGNLVNMFMVKRGVAGA